MKQPRPRETEPPAEGQNWGWNPIFPAPAPHVCQKCLFLTVKRRHVPRYGLNKRRMSLSFSHRGTFLLFGFRCAQSTIRAALLRHFI